MEKREINIDPKRVGIVISNYVRDQALKTGSFITYKENHCQPTKIKKVDFVG